MVETISQAIGRFVANLSYRTIPDEVIEKARCCVINGLAVGISSHHVSGPSIARKLIRQEELGAALEEGATLFCDGMKVSPMGAAFANAVLFHGRAQEDFLGSSHLGAVILPCALALAERNGNTGRQVLEAVVSGYEVGGFLDRAYSKYTTPQGFRASSVFGTFASSASASKLLRLTGEETANAIGFAASFAGGTLECWMAGTSEWRYHVGMAAREGIMAALLAKEGANSAPTSIEGEAGFLKAFTHRKEHDKSEVANLGKSWSIMKTGFKLFPMCDSNLTPVRTALSLMKEYRLAKHDIEKTVVKVSRAEYDYPGIAFRGPFRSIESTLMSTPFCVALALADGDITLKGLSRLHDPTLKEMIDKIEHLPDDRMQPYCCSMTVKTKQGKTCAKESVEGLQSYFLNMDQTIELARRVTAEAGIPSTKIGRLIDFVRNLDELPHVREIAELLGSCP